MEQHITTYFYSPINSDLVTEFIAGYQFIANQTGLKVNTQTFNPQSIGIAQHEFIILLLDELSVNQTSSKNMVHQIFETNKQAKSNLILVLDDIAINQLPDYLSYCQLFQLSKTNNWNADLDIENEPIEQRGNNVLQTIIDIVNYQQRVLTPQPNYAVTVFMAPPDEQTLPVFQKVMRELQGRPLNLTPVIINPTAKELTENPTAFKTLLTQAQIVIQFIGHKAIIAFPESELPVLKINKTIADFCQSNEGAQLKRLIYIPETSGQFDEILERKLSLFKNEPRNFTNAELIQTPLEKFKSIILSSIRELQHQNQQNAKSTLSSEVYIMYPPNVDHEIKPLLDEIKDTGYLFSVSQIELDQLELLKYHQTQLTNCQGVIIYTNGNQKWLQRKLSDLVKAPGWGRIKPYSFIGLVGSQNDEALLDTFKFLPIKKIDHQPGKLKQFLTQLTKQA